MNKNNKTFMQQYKEARIAALILLIGSLIFIISAVASEWLYIVSPLILTVGIFIFIYTILYLFLYWKCANYQKRKKAVPKLFRTISSILLISYLSLYQIDERTKKYRHYLLQKEMRFYILTWMFLCALIALLEFQFIQKNNFLWFGISVGIVTVWLLIDWILTIFIWKYRGNNNKWLKILLIITLNYRNYQLYKKIIKLNTKEKTATE